MPRQYMLALGGGVFIAAVIVGLVLAAAFAGYFTNPNKPVQVALADSAANQGPQGVFEVSIFRCAPQASPPAQPSGGRWDVSAHHIQDLPADWYTMVPACTGNDVLFQSFAEVNPGPGRLHQPAMEFAL